MCSSVPLGLFVIIMNNTCTHWKHTCLLPLCATDFSLFFLKSSPKCFSSHLGIVVINVASRGGCLIREDSAVDLTFTDCLVAIWLANRHYVTVFRFSFFSSARLRWTARTVVLLQWTESPQNDCSSCFSSSFCFMPLVSWKISKTFALRFELLYSSKARNVVRIWKISFSERQLFSL